MSKHNCSRCLGNPGTYGECVDRNPAAHTPGPWNPSTTHRGLEVKPFRVATAADARLIAAAPDLYEAARKALDILPPGPVKDELVDAVLKAEGRE